MSGKAPKQKGNRVERECVNLAKCYGFESKRAWGSDGRSLGWHEEVDMTITPQKKAKTAVGGSKVRNIYKFQVKARKSIADYLKPCKEVYGQILKEDRKEPLLTMRYKDFLDLLKMLYG